MLSKKREKEKYLKRSKFKHKSVETAIENMPYVVILQSKRFTQNILLNHIIM